MVVLMAGSMVVISAAIMAVTTAVILVVISAVTMVVISIRADIRITPIRVVLTKAMLSTRMMSSTNRKTLGQPMMRFREMI